MGAGEYAQSMKYQPLQRPVYLDNAATTAVDPEVIDSIIHYYSTDYGNPSAVHPMGIEARKAIVSAREALASQVGLSPEGVIFTSGGTEANNLAIHGFPPSRKRAGKHILYSAVEHPSVIQACQELENQGYIVEPIPVSSSGQIEPLSFEKQLRPDTILVCLMHANNEIGTIFPIEKYSTLIRQCSPHAHIHVDAIQTFGKLRVHLSELNVDSAAISAHKFHGPKGVGALFYRGKTQPRPLVQGGGQEFGLRSGTENVPGIVGLNRAAMVAERQREQQHQRIVQLRTRLTNHIQKEIDSIKIHGDPDSMLSTILSVAILGCPAEALLHHLEIKGIFVSAGSACHSKKEKSSHVLRAIHATDKQVASTLRFSLSRLTTEEEIDHVCNILPQVVSEVRAVGL